MRKQIESEFRALGFRSHTFSGKDNPYFTERETVITVTHDGRGRGGCIPRRMGKAVFVVSSSDIRDALEHVKQLISKPAV